MSARGDAGSYENLEKVKLAKESLARVVGAVLAIVYVIGVCAAKDLGYVLTDQKEDQLESLC